MSISSSTTKWGLIGRWLLAFLGFPIGGGVAYLIIGVVDDPLKGVVGGAIAGACIGGAQWLASVPTKKWMSHGSRSPVLD